MSNKTRTSKEEKGSGEEDEIWPDETKADLKNEAKEQIVKDYKDNKRSVPLLWFCVILWSFSSHNCSYNKIVSVVRYFWK